MFTVVAPWLSLAIDCRLTKAQLDGACSDSRFDQDFFVDLIFADVETGDNPSSVDASKNSLSS